MSNTESRPYILRNPDEPETVWNYRICGAKTKITGEPCNGRALRERDWFCGKHDPVSIEAREVERKAKYAAIEAANLARYRANWRTAGDDLRTDLVYSLRTTGYSILSSGFTIICTETMQYAINSTDKKATLLGCPDTANFIVVWRGQWKSDAFTATAAELREFI